MAIEAMYQTAVMTQWKEQIPSRYRFRLRDVKLLRALVLSEDSDARVTLALVPVKGGSTRSWYEYQMCSVQDGVDVDFVHSTGLVCVETEYRDTFKEVLPLDLSTTSRIWYKTLAEMGYNFGPSFQKHLMVESTMGQRQSRSIVNLQPPPSHANGQSSYPIHPAVIDGCFQAATPSLWKGHLPRTQDPVLVPKTIDSIVIDAGSVRQSKAPEEGIAYASAHYLGVGNTENARNYATNVELYDPKDGALMFQMKGLSSASMEITDTQRAPHKFMRVAWDADIDMLMDVDTTLATRWLSSKTTQQLISLVAHKRPGLSVLEMSLDAEDGSSLWMQQDDNSIRGACSEYNLAVRDAKALIGAQESLGSRTPRPQFHLVSDVSKPIKFAELGTVDLAIVNTKEEEIAQSDLFIRNLATILKKGGYIVATGLSEKALSDIGKTIELPGNVCICRVEKSDTARADGSLQSTVAHVSLLSIPEQNSFSKEMSMVLNSISSKWSIENCSNPVQDITSSTKVILVLDEIFSSIMALLNDSQWELLKHLTKAHCPILWVTSRLADPTRAAIVGFLSTIRAEEQIPIFTLDVENATGTATPDAVSLCLERLHNWESVKSLDPHAAFDYDFVERGGIIYTTRVCIDSVLTERQNDEPSARNTKVVDLHKSETAVQLRCERLGSLQALYFAELDAQPTHNDEGTLEVEIYAAGINYKDVVVTSKCYRDLGEP